MFSGGAVEEGDEEGGRIWGLISLTMFNCFG
jgi:hypothetical protein